jgi:hypothetical protein
VVVWICFDAVADASETIGHFIPFWEDQLLYKVLRMFAVVNENDLLDAQIISITTDMTH